MNIFDILFRLSIILLVSGHQSVPSLSNQIIRQIFNQSSHGFISEKIYMLHVQRSNPSSIESQFFRYCSKNKNCAIVNDKSERYSDLLAYIGYEENQDYFAIIDPTRNRKFVLPIVKDLKEIDIHIFNAKFQQGILVPFYSSEKIDSSTYSPCQKVVGSTFNHFLQKPALIKVLFILADNRYCEVCGQLLRVYADFAERTYDENTLIYGYYDILKNDHEKLIDYHYPLFAIFKEPEVKPIILEGKMMENLQKKLIELLTGHEKAQILKRPRKGEQITKKEDKEKYQL